jgi:hypothetical protein
MVNKRWKISFGRIDDDALSVYANGAIRPDMIDKIGEIDTTDGVAFLVNKKFQKAVEKQLIKEYPGKTVKFIY